MQSIAIKNSLQLSTLHIFMMVLGGVLLNTWIIQNHVMTREVYYNLLSEQMELFRIDEIFNIAQQTKKWNYLLAPILLSLRLLFVALLVQLPLVIRFIDVPFSKIYRIVTIAFIPLLILTFVQTIRLFTIPSTQFDEQTLAFVPLSLSSFLSFEHYDKHIYGFLSNFNLFELIWGVLLCKGLVSVTHLKKSDAAVTVAAIWTFIMLLQFILISYLHKVNA